MFAHVTELRYWKSEHSESTCEDAYGVDTTSGLFAVADGAGTTLFSDIWANILIKHYLAVPLLNTDAFEVEWWIRQAQEQFKHSVPHLQSTAWHALQKAQSQGSHSTLVTLRVIQNNDNSIKAEIFAFGDSCVIVGNLASGQVLSFPLSSLGDFEQAPICLPSKPSLFNRYFHQCSSQRVALTSSDIVVLATDAVAKWIIGAGAGRYTLPIEALRNVSMQTPETWAAFITECRSRNEMIDDDSTALIISLYDEPCEDAVPLGVTTEHSETVRRKRKNDFLQALAARNKEQAAICAGDAKDLCLEGVEIKPNQFLLNRRVADALREVLHVLRQEMNSPQGRAKVESIWQQHATLLQEEVCAENLRLTLARMGIPVESSQASDCDTISSLPTTTLSTDVSGQLDQAGSSSEPLHGKNIILSPEEAEQVRRWVEKFGPRKDT